MELTQYEGSTALLGMQLALQARGIAPLGFRKDGSPIWPMLGGSVSGFIPQIWSGALLLWLRKNLVFAQPGVVNRDYEGDIAARGDTVKIGMIGPVTIKGYVPNTDIDDPDELDIDETDLTIDQEDYFNFGVDDVDARQVGLPLVSAAMERAAYGLADKADQFVANTMVDAGTEVDNYVTGAGADTYEKLVSLGVALDESNVPSQGRFVIVSPTLHGLLRVDDRFVKYDSGQMPVDTKVLALLNGQIGEAAGFTVLKSNNIPAGVVAVAGSNISATYAEQISKVEAYRPQKRFSDAVKGLHVYGAKVTRPEGIVYLSSAS